MPLSVPCPYCDAPTSLPDRFAGKDVLCPQCNGSFSLASAPEVETFAIREDERVSPTVKVAARNDAQADFSFQSRQGPKKRGRPGHGGKLRHPGPSGKLLLAGLFLGVLIGAGVVVLLVIQKKPEPPRQEPVALRADSGTAAVNEGEPIHSATRPSGIEKKAVVSKAGIAKKTGEDENAREKAKKEQARLAYETEKAAALKAAADLKANLQQAMKELVRSSRRNVALPTRRSVWERWGRASKGRLSVSPRKRRKKDTRP